MTPPPMMTTWKRSDTGSVPFLNVSEEAGKPRAGEGGRGGLEALHGPGPEVEVQRAGRMLDGAPQGPAVLRHRNKQLRPGHPAPPPAAVVGGHQVAQRVGGQAALTGDVAEL